MENSVLRLSERFTRAVEYARVLHIERRKGTQVPYMAHLLGVAALVMGEAGHWECPVTEEMVIAAVLHDAVEDHGGAPRLAEIAFNFGPEVARMVEGLSDTLAEETHAKGPWLERKRAYIERLRHEAADVRLVSIADKLHNARAILEDYREVGPEVWKRFKRGRNDQLWYFRALIEVFDSFPPARIVEELRRVTDELDRISAAERGTVDSGQ